MPTTTQIASDLAREIVRLLDLWQSTDGDVGAEDVSDALAVIMGQRSEISDLAETLIAAEGNASGGMTDDYESEALWAAWDARLIDCAPDRFSDGSGISTGLVWWDGFGSESAIRAAVRS